MIVLSEKWMTQKLAVSTRIEMLTKLHKDYRRVTARRDKSSIISQVVGLGYDRKYAIKLLNRPAPETKEKQPRIRHRQYTKEVRELILAVHDIADMNS